MKKIPKLITFEGDEIELGAWPAIIAKVVKGVGTVIGGIAGAVKRRKEEKKKNKIAAAEQAAIIQQQNAVAAARVVQKKRNNQTIAILGMTAAVAILATKPGKKRK